MLILKPTIRFAIHLLDKYLIERIKLEELRVALQKLLAPFSEVVTLLLDSNPDNEQQLRSFYLANKARLEGTGIEVAMAVVREKIRDEKTRDFILDLLEDARQGQV